MNKGKWVVSVIKSILECWFLFRASYHPLDFSLWLVLMIKIIFLWKKSPTLSTDMCFLFSCGKLAIPQNIREILISLSRFGQSGILALCRCLAGRQSSWEMGPLQFSLGHLKFLVENWLVSSCPHSWPSHLKVLLHSSSAIAEPRQWIMPGALLPCTLHANSDFPSLPH